MKPSKVRKNNVKFAYIKKKCIFAADMVKLLIKIRMIMSKKSPTGDKIVKVMKWIAWIATAIASFIAGNQL